MASSTHPRREQNFYDRTGQTSIQKVCVIVGFVFFFVGIIGIFKHGFLGMHLSFAQNLIHLGSGVLAFWAADNTKTAYTYSIVFGSLYGILGVAGFLIGQPGYPGVPSLTSDQYLLRSIPKVLEFGSSDHSIHILLSAVLLSSALLWKRKNGEGKI